MKPQSSFRSAWSRRARSFTTPKSQTQQSTVNPEQSSRTVKLNSQGGRRRAPSISAPSRLVCLSRPGADRLYLQPGTTEVPSSQPGAAELPRAARCRRTAPVPACGAMSSPRPSLGLPNSLCPNIEPTRRAPPIVCTLEKRLTTQS